MVRAVIFFILFLVLFSVTKLTLAQQLEFSALTKLAGSVNSKGEESMPLLSGDQKKLFFARSVYDGNNGGRFAGQDIWCADKTSDGWRNATNQIQYLNNKDNNVLIGVSRDGKTFYTLHSSPSEKLEGIHFSKLTGNELSKPEFVPIPGIENEDFVGMFVSPDYDVIFISMRGTDTRGLEDIYISVKDRTGAWGKPRNMGPTINTNGFEIAPFLSVDKKRLYFSSNGLGGQGDADIFYCDRLYNTWETWSAPVNLGETINSKKFDAYFSIYGDSVAYFSSNRDQGLSDIYVARVSEKIGILPAGFRYVTTDEWNTLIGKNVPRRIQYAAKTTTLTSQQKEFLYYISNKLASSREVGFHLIVREEEDPEMTRARLKEIYSQLRQHGVDPGRIREEQNMSSIKNGTSGTIEVLLYKEEPR